MRYPSEYCQKCGEHIGWIGRFFQFLRIPWNRCKKPYKPKIVIDNSGASTWVNSAEYFLSDEGQKFLREMSEFAKRHVKKKKNYQP
jgi:hypothetical protein